MASINFVLTGKGGVGKSFIASALGQFYRDLGANTSCIDLDPNNPTLSAFKALEVERINVMENDEINPRLFDDLMERLLEAGDDDVVIVDTGSSTFIPLAAYAIENGIFHLLETHGHRVLVHAVIAGGASLGETTTGFIDLLDNFQGNQFVVWLNGYFGATQVNGKAFEDLSAIKGAGERIKTIIRLSRPKQETFGHDAERLQSAGLTLNEGITGEQFKVMERQRYSILKKMLFGLFQDHGLDACVKQAEEPVGSKSHDPQ